jgi:tetratricopeptide (TPR) repeat protein
MKSIFIASLLAFLVSACTNPINLKTASMYAEGCRGFQAQNEWWKARRACGRAAVNAKLGGAPNQTIAILWYEYGRTSGAICDYAEAQRGFDEAMKLDQATGGPVYMSLLEMARLNSAQGKFIEAANYYEKFWLAVPKNLAEKEDPVGSAEALEEQAEAYRQIGNTALSQSTKDLAQKLRAANPNKQSKTDHTPYGKYCGQQS